MLLAVSSSLVLLVKGVTTHPSIHSVLLYKVCACVRVAAVVYTFQQRL